MSTMYSCRMWTSLLCFAATIEFAVRIIAVTANAVIAVTIIAALIMALTSKDPQLRSIDSLNSRAHSEIPTS